MTAAGPGKTSPPRGGRCPWRSGRSPGGKNVSHSSAGGVFVRQCSPGRTAKGAVRSGRALSGRKNTSVARGGIFARQRSQGRAAKGAVRGGRALSGRKNTSAAAWGRFCAAMFAGPDGKGRCPRRSGRSPSRKNVPHSARERLSRLVWPYGGAKRPAAPGLTSGGALAPLRPPPFPHPPQRAGPDASPPGARACTGRQRRRRPTGGRRTSGGCRNDSA